MTATYNVTATKQDHTVSLSRTGVQGTKGDSITAATVDANNRLLLTMTNAAGAVVATLDAGTVNNGFDLNDLGDLTLTSTTDGQILRYDSSASAFVNHTFTTSDVSDIDNTAVTDGAVLVYNGTSSKYTATTSIENANTFLKGGSY